MLRCIPLLLSAAFFLGATDAQAQRRTEELMVKSGANAQLGQFEKLIQAGMDKAISDAADRGRPSNFTQEDQKQIRAVVSSTYSPQRMRQEVKASLAKSLTAADENQVLAFLDTDLGRRVTALDAKYLDKQVNMDSRQLAREMDSARKGIPQARVDTLRRLASALSMGEATARTVTNIFTSILVGVTTAMNERTADADLVKRGLEARQHHIAHAARQEAVARYAHQFQALEDDDLERLVAFVETPVGLKYSDAMAAAVGDAVTRASMEFGKQVGEIGKQRADARKAAIK